MDGLDFETAVEPDWVVEEQMIGAPSATDGMVTSYLLDDEKDLTIAVWDEETGEELWRDSAATGGGTTGVSRSAQTFSHDGKSHVTYLRPKAGSTWQYLVVADLATGKQERIANPNVFATTVPTRCESNAAVCLTGFRYGHSDPASLRYKIGTTRVAAIKAAADDVRADGYRMLGGQVFSTYSRGDADEDPEELGYLDGNKVLWHRPYTEVFGKDYSSDAGWEWADDDRTEFAIGSGHYFDPNWAEGAASTNDLTQRRIVALDRTSGETVWATAGAGGCPFTALDVVGNEEDEVLVACRWNAGKVSSTGGGEAVEYPETPDVDMIGLDQRTGRELWSVPLGDPKESADTISFVSNDEVLIVDLGDTIQVDVTTGDLDDVPEGTYLCERARKEFDAPHPGEHGKTLPFSGGETRFPCDETGTEIKTDTLSVAALTLADGDEGESVLVSGTDRMANYTVPEDITWMDRLRELW